MAITPIPAFNDNYLWLLDNGVDAIVVDPGDAAPVDAYLKSNNLNLAAILITHHHGDHIGGVPRLKQMYGCRTYGPSNDSVNGLDYRLDQGDSITIEELGLSFQVIDVPGHTRGHIAYFMPESSLCTNGLFCGDTLFSGGCGRLFEGTPQQMWQSMQKILSLPENTKIYPAHEYTLSNLKFASEVEPQNQHLTHYIEKVKALRELNQPSLPSELSVEKQVNPFLRIREPSVISSAMHRVSRDTLSEPEVFAVIRQWKDSF
ncbi:hydroxyacylglutathione hydrolase [Aliikangiella coralliicola]|uniref:Hydroxyacylglutathione hydrolase n=1 Tax=Aliikangiella coralliicola TaxID=2592383 RepID=A0A545UBB6_9GAMM|nr:hydroxyacylglutathione hydrolase [Aliikangiella coralliicola]